MAESSYDYGQIDKAIQRLPPELREIIYKEYVAIKQRERAVLGWNKVNKAILKKPFCYFMQQIVPTIVYLDDQFSSFEDYRHHNSYCYRCLFDEKRMRLSCLHKVSMKAQREKIPVIETRQDYESFLNSCVEIAIDFNQKKYHINRKK